MKKIVIWGASGHAKVVADIIRLVGEYQIEGFLDNVNNERNNSKFYGATILGGNEILPKLLDLGIVNIIMGFGNCGKRLQLADQVRKMGFQLVTAVHPGSIIASDVIIKPGTVVAAGAVINPSSIIGENAIINTSASIDHDCKIDDGVHICPGAHLAGKVTVGRATWIGIGSCVIEDIIVGEYTLIGAGSVVVKNIPANVIAYGNPAVVLKKNK
jgi:UDP-N-acetylbacillosamine N-acetyltransferase